MRPDQPLSPPPSHLAHPIVLVHGMGGFDQIRLELLARYPVQIDYFKGVAATLRAAGAPEVFAVALPPQGGIAERAAALQSFLDHALPRRRFHLVAHSMGGLDSRAYITHLGGASRALSLTTLGTPHRGSPLACITAGNIIGPFERAVARLGLHDAFTRIHAATAAHRDLRPDACADFNEQTPDAPGVAYFSYAGEPAPNAVPWFLQLPYRLLLRGDGGGPNDGLVTTASAQWTGWRGAIPADHVAMVGWQLPQTAKNHFECSKFYQSLLPDLAQAESQQV